ncbi:hypothetical protein J7K27_02490 [Candidatus Bathyarchaeota archaeon]|nr:hypothetical protein [Candidatus Bathyarchaeota archaeon]
MSIIHLDEVAQLFEEIRNSLDKLDNALASIGTDYLLTRLYGFDGTNWQPIKVTSGGKVEAWLV